MTPPAGQRWTRSRPTEPGWYWWRTHAVTTGQLTGLQVVQIEEDGYCRQEGEYVSHLGGEWQGPIKNCGAGR